MRTKMTQNGVSTTTGLGQEQFERFRIQGAERYQYDYRHTDGSLFTCVKRSLAECRDARDEWLNSQLPEKYVLPDEYDEAAFYEPSDAANGL